MELRLIQGCVDPSFSCDWTQGVSILNPLEREVGRQCAGEQIRRKDEMYKCLGWNHGTNIQLNFSAVILYRKDLYCFIIPRSRVSGGDIHLLRAWLIRAPSRHFCEAEGEAFRASSRKDQLLLALKAWGRFCREHLFF